MRQVTFQSAAAYLIDDLANFAFPYVVKASLPGRADAGLTGVEERRGKASMLRLSLEFAVTLESAAAVADWRNAMQALTTEPVLCPLWIAKRRKPLPHPVSADWWAVYRPGVPVDIYATADIPPGLDAETWVVPLLVGVLDEVGDVQSVTSGIGIVEVRFRENSTSGITLDAYTPASGPAVSGVTPYLLPWRHNTQDAPRGQGARVQIDRQPVGQGRVTADTYFAQPAVRYEERSYVLSDDEPWQFLRLFQVLGGGLSSLWIPGEAAEASLTADVLSSATALTVDDPGARGSNAYLLLDDGTNRTPVRITGTAGSDWTLSAAVGVAYAAEDTHLFGLILGRFLTQEVSLRFTHDTMAETSVRFRETPWEVTPPAGETVGASLGALPVSAYLYTLTIGIPGNEQTYRFTDFERDLTNSGNTWAAQKIDHGDIRESVGLDRQQVKIRVRNFSAPPFDQLFPNKLEYPLMLEITEVDVSGSVASNLRPLFYGELSRASVSGPTITAIAESMGAVLDRKIPRKLLQPTCNYALFDSGCGIDKATWQYDALSVSWNPITSVLVIDTITKAAVSQSGLAVHKFAGGLIEVGTGATRQLRWVADNLVQSGANLSLTLATPLNGSISSGTAVKLYPGCDGSITTCVATFNNRSRFGGLPFMPVGNPSFLRVSRNISAGGKK